MAESAQQADVTRGGEGQRADTHPSVQEQVRQFQKNPALQPLEQHPLRHVHHGQTGAMWAGVTCAFVGFVVGGISVVLGPNWWLFTIGAVLVAAGLVIGKVMQMLGLGIYQKK